MLPEPRTEAENNYLDSLGAEMFYLGINDKDTEGSWRFNSDSSIVTWQYWAEFDNRPEDPNGGENENCAIMMRNTLRESTVTETSSWADVQCDGSSIWSTMSLVCERAGKYRYVTFINGPKAPSKVTKRGGRAVEITALSSQCCDWPTLSQVGQSEH